MKPVRTIAVEWAAFSQGVPDETSPEALKCMRAIFYTGAARIADICAENIEETGGDIDKLLDLLDDLSDEVAAFTHRALKVREGRH